MYRKKPEPPKPEWKYYKDEESYWRYYDRPDGEQIFKKTVVTTRYATMTGLIMAFHDIAMYSHPKGFKNTIKRAVWVVGPMAAMGATFSIVANTLQNLRNKDDHWNYLAGAWAAAPIFGYWQRSGLSWYWATVVFSIAAFVKKEAVNEGWTLMPEHPQQFCNAVNANHDYSLVRDWGPKGFTTGVPPPPEPIPEKPCNLEVFRHANAKEDGCTISLPKSTPTGLPG